MKFSIIIPVYNVERYLCDCLDSIMNQTFSDWEAICVNDGSKDGSVAILEEYAEKDSRIKIVLQNNSGTAAARNTGLKSASGEYIFFLDSDDWIEHSALQTIADHLGGEDVFCFSGRRFFETSKTFNPADELKGKLYESGMEYYNENALIHRDFAFVCVVLRVYKKEFIIREKLFFDADVSYEDNLWVPQMLHYASSIKVIPDSLYIYRVRDGSKMQEVSLARKKDMLKVANRLATFFIPKKGFNKTVIYCAITHHYQVVLQNANKTELKELRQFCDWKLYCKVSRTKIRHRFNFLKNRFS